jgi:outer membrane receptor protein involved in Fe transport
MKKPLPFRKKILASLIRSAVITAAFVPAMSWAQSSDATLRGKAAPNMQITAKNIATGARRVTTSGADGAYALVGIPPGTYQVDAGPGTEKNITLSVASTGNLDFTESAPAGSASSANAQTLTGVTVTGIAQAEVKTSEVGGMISQRQINTIPQVSRNFLEFADTVPGMVFTSNNGHTSIQSGAQDNSNINVYIDGIGQKNYIRSGGIAGQSGPSGHGDTTGGGDLGNPFPQLAIGEYKVITSNYKAEFDQISSAAIVAQTKSGTNEFHGEIFGTTTDQNWRSSTPAEQEAGKKTASKDNEYGFAVGGPIIQDAMHFFFTYEGKEITNPTAVVPPSVFFNGVNASTFLPASVQAQYGPAAQPFHEDLYFGKIDWEFSDRDRIDFEVSDRRENQITGANEQIATSAAYHYVNEVMRPTLRWQHSADAWSNDLTITYEKTKDLPTPPTNSTPGEVYTWQGTGSNNQTLLQINGQDARSYFSSQQKASGIQDDFTWNNLSFAGDHVIKAGFKYKDVSLTNADALAGDPLYYYGVTENGTATQPYLAVFGQPIEGLNPTVTSKDKQIGGYIQDDWAVNDHLTLNLGVRNDYESSPSYQNFVTPANLVAALNSPYPGATNGITYAQALALGGVNLNNYISNGHNRSAFKNEWQPRLGFSYDLDGDEQHVIFGGAGRAYDRQLFETLSLETTKLGLAEPNVYFQNPFGTGLGNCGLNAPVTSTCVPWDTKYLNPANLQALGSAGGEANLLNNNLKAPYSDQFSIGMRNKIGDWNSSASFARILSFNGIIGQLGNRYANGNFYDTVGGAPWGSSGPPGFGGNLVIFDNGVESRSSQVLLSLEKPYTKEDGWYATISYTYTDAQQNRLVTDGYAFDLPSIKDYPFTDSNLVAKHRLVAVGSIDIPWEVTLTGKLVLEAERPVTQINCGTGNANGAGGPCFPSTTIPAGQSFLFGGPIFNYREIDLSAIKNFDLTRGMNLQLRLDAINLFNYKNYSDYNWPYPAAATYNTTGNIYSVPRTFRFSLRYTF